MQNIGLWCTASAPKVPLFLWVLESNIAAQAFYKKLGADDVGSDVWTPPGGGSVVPYHAADFRGVIRPFSFASARLLLGIRTAIRSNRLSDPFARSPQVVDQLSLLRPHSCSFECRQAGTLAANI